MKKVLALLLALAMAFALVACGGNNTDSNNTSSGDADVQVGIVLPTKDEPRWLQDQASFETALANAGFTSEVLFSQGKSETELSNVEALLEKNIKVLVICAQDAAAAGAAVQKAKDAGVTVVCYDRLITGTDAVDYYITFNSFAVGVAQGQFLIDAYAGQTGVPLYLYSGAVTDNNAFIFFAGAWSVLNEAVANGQFVVENCPAIDGLGALDPDADHETLSTILGTITTDWDFSKAKTLAEGNLVANDASAKGNVAILAPNDGTARAIADAFTADSDVTSYVITGQDAENASLKYIQDGKQSMTVWKNTATLAETTCDLVSTILNGQTPSAPASYNNQVKDVPSVEEAVTVITIDTLPDLIAAGNFSQSDIDAAQ
ncbi:MAG: sugar-binding protein [Oscillospiraceae bacterium]|nr:sugar-binding protein [Oscillospiraceae bacterium]